MKWSSTNFVSFFQTSLEKLLQNVGPTYICRIDKLYVLITRQDRSSDFCKSIHLPLKSSEVHISIMTEKNPLFFKNSSVLVMYPKYGVFISCLSIHLGLNFGLCIFEEFH